jgi:hypothetical protein
MNSLVGVPKNMTARVKRVDFAVQSKFRLAVHARFPPCQLEAVGAANRPYV